METSLVLFHSDFFIVMTKRGQLFTTIQNRLVCNRDGWPRSSFISFCATAFTPWQALSGAPARERANHTNVWAHRVVFQRGAGCRQAGYGTWTEPPKCTSTHLHDWSLGLHRRTFCDSRCQCLIDGSHKPDIMTPLKCLRDLGGHKKEN